MGYSGSIWTGQQLTPVEFHQPGFHCWSHCSCRGCSHLLHSWAAPMQRHQAARPTTLAGHLVQSQPLSQRRIFIQVDKTFPSTVQRWSGSSWRKQGCPVWAQEKFVSLKPQALTFILANRELFAKRQSPAGLNPMNFLWISKNKIPWWWGIHLMRLRFYNCYTFGYEETRSLRTRVSLRRFLYTSIANTCTIYAWNISMDGRSYDLPFKLI